MPLPHRLIIDGVEQCASDDKKEFLRMAYLYLGDLEKEFAETGTIPLHHHHLNQRTNR